MKSQDRHQTRLKEVLLCLQETIPRHLEVPAPTPDEGRKSKDRRTSVSNDWQTVEQISLGGRNEVFLEKV